MCRNSRKRSAQLSKLWKCTSTYPRSMRARFLCSPGISASAAPRLNRVACKLPDGPCACQLKRIVEHSLGLPTCLCDSATKLVCYQAHTPALGCVQVRTRSAGVNPSVDVAQLCIASNTCLFYALPFLVACVTSRLRLMPQARRAPILANPLVTPPVRPLFLVRATGVVRVHTRLDRL